MRLQQRPHQLQRRRARGRERLRERRHSVRAGHRWFRVLCGLRTGWYLWVLAVHPSLHLLLVRDRWHVQSVDGVWRVREQQNLCDGGSGAE